MLLETGPSVWLQCPSRVEMSRLKVDEFTITLIPSDINQFNVNKNGQLLVEQHFDIPHMYTDMGIWRYFSVYHRSSGFYTKGRPLVKSNPICPSDKFSWGPGCPVLNNNIQGNFCISQGNDSSDNLLKKLSVDPCSCLQHYVPWQVSRSRQRLVWSSVSVFIHHPCICLVPNKNW